MPTLKRTTWLPLLGLAVPVALMHVVVIDQFRALLQPPSLLQNMATPMYTRVLLPETPPEAQALAPDTPEAQPVPTRPQAVLRGPDAAAPPPMQAASQAKTSARPPARKPRPAPPAADKTEAASVDGSANPDVAQAPMPEASVASAPPANSAAVALRDAAASSPAAGPAGSASSSAGTASSPEDSAQAAAKPGDGGDAAADSAHWPPDTQLNYRLGGNYRGELHGKARVSWQKKGANYQARVDLDVGLLLSMQLTSQGRFTAKSLVPQVYEELVRKKRRTITLGEDTVQLADGKRVPRPAQVQDTASQFIELSHRFASGQQPLQVGQQVHFSLARPNRLAQWTYDVVEETEINLPTLGPTRAFLVRPRPSDGDSKGVSAQMWLAPSLHHLPVRILLSLGDDKQVDLMLERIDQASP